MRAARCIGISREISICYRCTGICFTTLADQSLFGLTVLGGVPESGSRLKQARLYDWIINHAIPANTDMHSTKTNVSGKIMERNKPTHASNTAVHHSPPTLLYSAAVAARWSRCTNVTHSAGVVTVSFSRILSGLMWS